jgi:hypothetical protein
MKSQSRNRFQEFSQMTWHNDRSGRDFRELKSTKQGRHRLMLTELNDTFRWSQTFPLKITGDEFHSSSCFAQAQAALRQLDSAGCILTLFLSAGQKCGAGVDGCATRTVSRCTPAPVALIFYIALPRSSGQNSTLDVGT